MKDSHGLLSADAIGSDVRQDTCSRKRMTDAPHSQAIPTTPKHTLMGLLKPYKGIIAALVLLAMLSNGLSLVLPQIIAKGIDAFTRGSFVLSSLLPIFVGTSVLIFVFTYLQNIVQTYASERVARDLRQTLADTLSRQSFAYIQKKGSATLLTNLTSDIDAVKLFVSQAIAAIVSSLLLIVGSGILLLLINWKLALAVLTIVPVIGGSFFFVLGKVRVLFKKGQEVIDRLNKIINESILGSALIRVLNSQAQEYDKFLTANTDAKSLGLSILRLFAMLIPVITFTSNMATLIILALGGHFVISGSMTLGDFSAFNGYIAILIFPILIIGFMSGVIARASSSYKRITDVLDAPVQQEGGTLSADNLQGNIEFKNVSLLYGEKKALSNVSFTIAKGTTTAIIGPTGAGKTQLLTLLIGLIRPTSGTVLFDDNPLDDYDSVSLHKRIGLVFQDSIVFNMSLRENIAFSSTVRDEDLEKAINTAELHDFIHVLPNGLSTRVSERGTSLSGGQKQRIMLARALAINPTILLLDDFTARVDTTTEQKILENIRTNYPGITLVSITQTIVSAEKHDQIILLMEGELLATGTHKHLMTTCPEYVQISESQRSTQTYESTHNS